MRAAVYKVKQRFSVEEIPTPEPGPEQVLVKLKYCAICGTDVHGFLYDAVPPGMVIGHECCGTVARLGPGVSGWRYGESDFGGSGMPPPGEGPGFVREPRFNFGTEGFSGRPLRGYAEYLVMDDWEPTPIPDGVSNEEAELGVSNAPDFEAATVLNGFLAGVLDPENGFFVRALREPRIPREELSTVKACGAGSWACWQPGGEVPDPLRTT